MTKEKVNNQEVNEQAGFRDGDVEPSCEGQSCANVADEEQPSTDTMAEENADEANEFVEPSQEEVIAIWRDKYMRLQAEFDNYRKRTLREKMDMVATAGADVLKVMLTVLDDMHRAKIILTVPSL